MSIDDITPEEWDTSYKESQWFCGRSVPAFSDLVDKVSRYVEPLEEDPVNKPSHYNEGAVECVEAIEASMSSEEFKGYLKGNTIKYIWRYDYKGKPVEDLRKARWYLEKLIEANL